MSGRGVHDRYQSTAVTTSRPGHLIVMLHHGGVKQLNLAERSLADGDLEATNRHLIRTQDIINEIRFSFADDEGGELVQCVRGVYGYMQRRLVEANAGKDSGPIAEVRDMLREMSEAWGRAGQGTGETVPEGRPFDLSG